MVCLRFLRKTLCPVVLSLAAAASVAGAQQTDSPAAQFTAVMNRYCLGCHNDKLKTADFSLSSVSLAKIPAEAAVWEKVLTKLRAKSMPPAGVPRPDNAAYEAFVTYLESELDRAAAARPNPGRPSIHRLNRAEYTNAIRDLLAIEIDVESKLEEQPQIAPMAPIESAKICEICGSLSRNFPHFFLALNSKLCTLEARRMLAAKNSRKAGLLKNTNFAKQSQEPT